MHSRERLIELIRERCLETGTFSLKSGVESHIYIDLRPLTLSPEVFYIAEAIAETRTPGGFDAIGGPTVGADPIVGAFLHRAHARPVALRGFLVRPEEKAHGKSGLVIGPVRQGDRCLLVEDVTTSGGSLLRAATAIEAMGCKAVMAISVVDRGQGAVAAFKARGIPFLPVLTLSDIEERDVGG